MKTYKNIESFLKDNPSDETIAQVMAVINKSAIKELKQEIRKKESHLRKVQSLMKKLEPLKLDKTEAENLIKSLTSEIEKMRKELPVVVKKNKVVTVVTKKSPK